MPRGGRTFEEGRTYHVYNRVGGGLMPFSERDLAKTFVGLLRMVMKRNNAVVLGWCLLEITITWWCGKVQSHYRDR